MPIPKTVARHTYHLRALATDRTVVPAGIRDATGRTWCAPDRKGHADCVNTGSKPRYCAVLPIGMIQADGKEVFIYFRGCAEVCD